MSTRNDLQIAQDLIRFINIMNDLIDNASYVLRDLNPETGEKLQVEDPPGSGTFRDTTFEELKERVERICQNIVGYHSMIKKFVTKFGDVPLADALSSLNLDPVVIKSDFQVIKDVSNYVFVEIGGVSTKEELIPYADYIDANIVKLVLVRRSWNLGL